MLKNKKKLRRHERRTGVTRAAQTLVLAGALLMGGTGSAWAAGGLDDGDLTDANAAASTWTIDAGNTMKSGLNTVQGGTNHLLNPLNLKATTQNVAATIVGDAAGLNTTFTVTGKNFGLTVQGTAGSTNVAPFTSTLTIGNAALATTVDVGAGAIAVTGGAGDTTKTKAGGAATLIITTSATLMGAGTLDVTGGAGDTTNVGGNALLTLNGGARLAGGAITVAAGATGSTGVGGTATLALGAGATLTGGGAISIAGGSAGTTGAGSLASMTLGAGATASAGGALNLTGGSAVAGTTTGTSGNATLTVGTGTGLGATASVGGAINLLGGSTLATTTTGSGGAVTLTINTGSTLTGGGALNIIGGDKNSTADNGNGGNTLVSVAGGTLTVTGATTITGGAGTGTNAGADGTAKLAIDATTGNAAFSTTTTTVNKGGTLAMTSGANTATHTGNVVLNNLGAKLAVAGAGNIITGNLDINQTLTVATALVTANALVVNRTTTVKGVDAITADSISIGTALAGGNLSTLKLVIDGTGGAASVNKTTVGGAVLATTVNAGGTLEMKSSSTVAANIATHTGDVTLATATSTLNVLGGKTAGAAANEIAGNLTVTKGTVHFGTDTTAGYLQVTGAGKVATFTGDSTIILTNAQLYTTGNAAMTLGGAAGSLVTVAGAKLVAQNARTGQNVAVVDNTTALAVAAGTLERWAVSGSALQSYSWGAGAKAGELVVSNKAMPGLSAPMTGLLWSMQEGIGFDQDSPNRGVRFASRAIGVDAAGNRLLNDRQAAATVEGAAQTATVGAVHGATLSAQRAGIGAVAARTSLANPIGDAKGASLNLQAATGEVTQSGISGGNVTSAGGMRNGLGLWIMPLWQNDNVFGVKSGSFKTGYNSSLGGVAIGADYTVESAFRFGLAFNLGGGFAQSNGDFNKTDNSFNFWGIAAYGGWTQNNFGLTADIGYSSTFNRVEQSTPAVLGFGSLKSDVNSHAWSAGLRAEYKFETGFMDITPHVGARFTGLTTQGYSVKGGGGTVFKVDDEYQAIWTFPVGVTFSKDIVSDSGWTFRPMIDLGVIPAAGDVDARSRVRIPGVASSAELKTRVVDHWTFDGTAGFEVKNNDVSFGLNYNLQASEHRTGHGLFATFRYEF